MKCGIMFNLIEAILTVAAFALFTIYRSADLAYFRKTYGGKFVNEKEQMKKVFLALFLISLSSKLLIIISVELDSCLLHEMRRVIY